MYRYVAIERQYCSGGQEIARILAKKIGYKLYDHEVLVETANRLELPAIYISDLEETSSKNPLFNLSQTALGGLSKKKSIPLSDQIYNMEREVILDVSKDQNCIFWSFETSKITDESSEIFLVTKYGMCIRFKETDVRSMGRNAMGVIGMNLDDGDEIVGMQLNTQGDRLLIVSEMGMGKRTNIDEFTVQKRGGKGIRCYRIAEKTGNLIGVKAVKDDNEVMMITTEGVIIQIAVEDISIYKRNTSGVKMINLDEGVTVAKIAKVRQKPSDGTQEFDEIGEMDEQNEEKGEPD